MTVASSRLNFRRCTIYTLLALGLFHLVTYAGFPIWPGAKTYNSSGAGGGGGEGEELGCDTSRFAWCNSIRPPPAWFFYLCYVLFIGVAFPSMNVALTTLFSKIIGPRRQGTEQGLLQVGLSLLF